MASPIRRHLPWGTIIINITGSMVIGFFGTLTLAHGRCPVSKESAAVRDDRVLRRLHNVFVLRPADPGLLRIGENGRASLNVALSVALCLAAVAAGHWVAAGLDGGAVPVAQLEIEEEA